jgi:N-acyl-D-amino-acid deacylase
MYSIIIRGGKVANGLGTPLYRADVAIDGNHIAAIAKEINESAETVINAEGMVIAPGFIDIHTHTDCTILANPLSDSKIMQGVTTEVVGNCGIGSFPVASERASLLAKYLAMHEQHVSDEDLTWSDFSQYAQCLTARGIGINLAPLVAHGTLRIAVVGFDDRPPTPRESETMCQLLQTALDQGAWGLSTGLIYPPGSFADTNELTALAKVVAAKDSLFTSHVRGESTKLLEAIDEMIVIGEQSHARMQVSHLKAIGQANWGKGREALRRIIAARANGIDIAADQYPYAASSTSLTALVPQWAHAGGVDALMGCLASPQLHERLAGEIGLEMRIRGGPEKIMVASVISAGNADFVGSTINDIAKTWDCSAEDAVMRLLWQERGGVGAVYFSLSDDDIDAIMTSDIVAVGSDGRGLNDVRDAKTATHPRSYGTFARVLGHYVRERQLLPLETAIYKMTALPARRLQLTDRGRIQVGLVADVVVFNPDTVIDIADFKQPHHYAKGVEYVLVNGQFVVKEGHITGNTPGKVLRKADR